MALPPIKVDPPVALDHYEKMQIRQAAFKATRIFPGPIGEVLSREILTWEEFGYRFGSGSLMRRLIAEILKAPESSPVTLPRNVVGATAVGYE